MLKLSLTTFFLLLHPVSPKNHKDKQLIIASRRLVERKCSLFNGSQRIIIKGRKLFFKYAKVNTSLCSICVKHYSSHDTLRHNSIYHVIISLFILTRSTSEVRMINRVKDPNFTNNTINTALYKGMHTSICILYVI